MRLTISHRTRYRYNKPLPYGLQRIRLRPWSSDGQIVRKWRVAFEGAKVEAEYTDHYLNQVALVSADENTDTLVISIDGEVDTTDTAGLNGLHHGSTPLWLYRRETPLTEAGEQVSALADSVAGSGKSGVALMHHLSAAISNAVTYRKGTTNVATTAEDAMEAGSGVCQDQTHVFISAARRLGLPARYVSGYLMMTDRINQEAGHAWAEAYVDDLGWVGFDISNGISPDARYVRIATGLDYAEAAPVSGMLFGSGDESMDVSIQIQQQ